MAEADRRRGRTVVCRRLGVNSFYAEKLGARRARFVDQLDLGTAAASPARRRPSNCPRHRPRGGASRRDGARCACGRGVHGEPKEGDAVYWYPKPHQQHGQTEVHGASALQGAIERGEGLGRISCSPGARRCILLGRRRSGTSAMTATGDGGTRTSATIHDELARFIWRRGSNDVAELVGFTAELKAAWRGRGDRGQS